MSQGTSGDQMWMDYGKPKKEMSLDAYSDEMAQAAFKGCQRIQYHDWAPLVMREAKVTLGFRLPDAERLAWARKIVAGLHGRLPKTQPEIYAREQIFLEERPTAELKLQAIRIGELGITAIPNEVFAITGLKIKAQSPLRPTFNIELANGAEGYIPTPEQHHLGGYTTWPARTAGLDPQAEPRIVERILQLLEEVSGQPRRKETETFGSYAKAVLASKPVAYWRFGEFSGPIAFDSSGHNHHGHYEEGIVFYLDGPASANFSGERKINRCAHFAGGRMAASIKGLGASYSVEMWFWNGMAFSFNGDQTVQPIQGILFSRGTEGAKWGATDKLGLGGPNEWGRLAFWADGSWSHASSIGRSSDPVPVKSWNYVVMVRDRERVTAYLNGKKDPEISCLAELPYGPEEEELFIGGPSQPYSTFEGKIDEVAIYNRALSPREIAKHYQAAAVR